MAGMPKNKGDEKNMKYKYNLTDEEKEKGGKIMRISTEAFNTGVVFPDGTIGSVWNEEYDD